MEEIRIIKNSTTQWTAPFSLHCFMFAPLHPCFSPPPLLSTCLPILFFALPCPLSRSPLLPSWFCKIIHLETQVARCNFLSVKPCSGTSAKGRKKAGDLYRCWEANRKIIRVCTWKCQSLQEQSFSQAVWLIDQPNSTDICQKNSFFFFLSTLFSAEWQE